MTASKRKNINLKSTHPSLMLLYFFSALIFSMLTLNPIYLLISFLAAFSLNCFLQGTAKAFRSLRFFFPFHLLITLLNALFSGNGLTVIFYIGNRPVTVESLIYGFASGLMLLTILLWFQAYSAVASSDQLIAVGGERFPQTALMLAMILRYVPDTIRHGRSVEMNQKALLGEEKLEGKEKASFFVRMSSVLMTWSMENALDTSIAMRAKGYPSEERSNYRRQRFSRYDLLGIIFILMMIIVQIYAFSNGSADFLYYPYLTLPPSALSLTGRVLAFVFYAIFLFFPFYLEFNETIARWKLRRTELEFKQKQSKKNQVITTSDSLNEEYKTYMQRNKDLNAKTKGKKYISENKSASVAASLENVSFTYPGSKSKALTDINLAFKRGSLCLITGPSGSGKTSLLHLLAPLLTPEGKIEGEVKLYGDAELYKKEELNDVQIGFVQQNPENQIILDSVWHEMAFALENQGLSNAEIERRLAETSIFFGLSDWMDRRVSELSGGEKQILNLASSLVMQPDLLLLDEPMAQLDPIARKRFLSMLTRVHDETGTTIIMSEHMIDDILPQVDRVVMLKQGSVAFDGTPDGYSRHLLEEEKNFGHSLPLAARMAAVNEVYNHAATNLESPVNSNLPLTVRDGREYLAENLDGIVQKPHSAESILSEKNNDTDIADEDKEIVLEDVWFRYDKDAPFVLRGANLTIKKGELHAILGGNGSGKSTLLYLLSRSLPALRGKIKRKANQQIAMLNQNPMAVFSQHNVESELMEFSQRFNYDKEDVEAIMQRLGIKHLAKRHPYDISGGEMQKTALAKALLTKPDVLLLDEPVKGLDPVARMELVRILSELKESGMTMVLVTHDLDFVSRISDRCSMIFDGHIEGTAKMEEFFADNAYFTTTAQRLTRGILPGIVTEKALFRSLT